jgi:putative cardiolipin synthase
MAELMNRCKLVQLLSSLAMLGLAGCAAMRPAVLPEERALPAAETAFWRPIANAHPGDWYHVLNRGDEALDWRLRAIDSATVSLDMETFLWKPDQSGRQVLVRLLAAADRGVRVRLLLDDAFTMHEDLALHAIDRHPNIEVRIYNPTGIGRTTWCCASCSTWGTSPASITACTTRPWWWTARRPSSAGAISATNISAPTMK